MHHHAAVLGFQRAELERFAEIRGIKWIEDESNEDTKYLRNAIRHNIIPELEKFVRDSKRQLHAA